MKKKLVKSRDSISKAVGTIYLVPDWTWKQYFKVDNLKGLYYFLLV